MPTKPLYTAPAKPRGLESIAIDRVEFIKLLKEEKVRQAKRVSVAKHKHKDEVIRILQAALKNVRSNGMPGKRRYQSEWVLELPYPPTFNPCNYDETIHRLEHDTRETLVLSAQEWGTFFPCDLNGDGS